MSNIKKGKTKIFQDVKRAGTGYVDLFSGILGFSHSDVAYSGENLPLNISHIYKSDLAQSDIIVDGITVYNRMENGSGWKINFNQQVKKINDSKIAFIDGEGELHIFLKSYASSSEYSGQKYVELEGTNLSLYDSGSSYIISDPYKNELHFSSSNNYALQKIKTFEGITLDILYDSKNRISSITDVSLRGAQFLYTDDRGVDTNLLQKISGSGGKTIKFGYSGSLLTRMYYIGINGQIVDYTEFTYSSDNLLTLVKDQTGHTIEYKYSPFYVNGIAQHKRVSIIEEKTRTKTISFEGITEYDYDYSNGETSINYFDTFFENSSATYAANVITQSGINNCYHFDRNGNCVLQYESMSKNAGELNKPKNGMHASCADGYKTHSIVIPRKQADNPNLITNGGFENNYFSDKPDNWTTYSQISVGNSSIEGRYGLGITNGEIYQDIPFNKFDPEAEYVISGFAAISDYGGNMDYTYGRCRISVEFLDAGNRRISIINADFDKLNKALQYIAKPFTTKGIKNAVNVRVKLEFINFDAAAFFDDIRLEKATVLTTEAKPSLILSINNEKTIMNFSDITRVYGYINEQSQCSFDINGTNGLEVTPIDIIFMQTNKHSIFVNGVAQAVQLQNEPFIGFNNGCYYRVSDLEVFFDREVNASNKNLSVVTKKDSNKDVVESIMTDKYGTEFLSTSVYDNHKLKSSKDFRNIITENIFSENKTHFVLKSEQSLPAEQIVSTTVKTASGNYIYLEGDTRSSSKNLRGTVYSYNEDSDELKKITLPGMQEINYEYHHHDGALKKTSGTYDRIDQKIEYFYTKGMLTKILVNNTDEYKFEYNGFGDLTGAYENNAFIYSAEHEFSIHTQDPHYSSIYYRNGQTLKTEFNQYGNPSTAYYNGNAVCDYIYDSVSNNLKTQKTYLSRINGDSSGDVTWDYGYDDINKALKTASFYGDGHSGLCNYEFKDDAPSAVEFEVDGLKRRTEIEHEKKNGVSKYPDNRVTGIKYKTDLGGVVASAEYGYDKLSRINKKLTKNASGIEVCSEEYKYLDVINAQNQTAERTTVYVDKILFSGRQDVSSQLSYTYDLNGNITAVYENGLLKVKYGYDNLQRLIREDNRELNQTTAYEYDSYGNLRNKYQEPFTEKELNFKSKAFIEPAYVSGVSFMSGGLYSLNVPAVSDQYGYSGTGRKNRLIKYNGISLADYKASPYDNEGNPLVYFYHGDAHRYWECNWILGKKLRKLELKKASTNLTESTVEFKYNGFGLRHKKLAGNKVSEYFYSGSQLIRENRGNDVILYYYDASGITAIEYIVNGVSNHNAASRIYYYRKNLQGDIIALLDESGKSVVKYTYNAWGKCVVLTDTSGISLSTINPIRYRGYYYDEETGFYYLVSRYYDPEVGRFINADDINYLDPLSINGQNLYAYCLNNPVMLSDPYGHIAHLALIKIGIVALFVVVALGILESQTHFFENSFNALGYAIENAISNIDWESISNDISSWWDNIFFSDKSGKVTPPSWVNTGMVNPLETPSQNADRIMIERYGSPKKGPGGEHNWIKKWIEYLRGGRGRGGRGGPPTLA